MGPRTMLPEYEEDDLDELPPIDGEPGESAESPAEAHEIDDDGDDRTEGTLLDDTTGEDDPQDASELEGDEGDTGWLEEASDSAELDLGDPMLLDAGAEALSLEDADEGPTPDEDFGVRESDEASILDSAEEGPVDADEELRETDLPLLDADDGPGDEGRGDRGEGKGEEDGLLDERLSSDEPLGVPWAAEPWSRVGPVQGLAWLGLTAGVTALACVTRGAIVAGRVASGAHELVRVDLEGARQVLDAAGLDEGRVAALAAEGDTLAAVVDGGRVFLSRDGGQSFEALAVPEGVEAADAVLAAGVLWVRTKTGSLLAARRGDDGKMVLERCAVPGVVVGLCREIGGAGGLDSGGRDGAGGVLALAADEGGRPATLVRGRDVAGLAWEAVQAPGGKLAGGLVARGGHVAYLATSPRAGVQVRHAGGPWKRFTWDGRVTVLAMLDAAGTLLAATYSESDDTTGLVRVDRAGAVSLVARVGAARDDPEADGRAVAMARDDARGVIWVAGGFGVAVFLMR